MKKEKEKFILKTSLKLLFNKIINEIVILLLINCIITYTYNNIITNIFDNLIYISFFQFICILLSLKLIITYLIPIGNNK